MIALIWERSCSQHPINLWSRHFGVPQPLHFFREGDGGQGPSFSSALSEMEVRVQNTLKNVQILRAFVPCELFRERGGGGRAFECRMFSCLSCLSFGGLQVAHVTSDKHGGVALAEASRPLFVFRRRLVQTESASLCKRMAHAALFLACLSCVGDSLIETGPLSDSTAGTYQGTYCPTGTDKDASPW